MQRLLGWLARMLPGAASNSSDRALEEGLGALEMGDIAGATQVAASLRARGLHGQSAFLLSFVSQHDGDNVRRVNFLREAHSFDSAEPSYRIELAKALADNLELREATQFLSSVLAMEEYPAATDPVLHFMLAGWHHSLGEIAEARGALGRALRLKPDFPEAAANLSELLFESGAVDESRAVLQSAHVASPRPHLLIRRALYLPAAYSSTAEILVARERFATDLAALERMDDLQLERPELEIGRTAFFLAYQGMNDRLELERLGRIIRRGYRKAATPLSSTAGRSTHARQRIGLVSPYFYRHSVGRAFLGFVEGLDRTRFEVRLFCAPGTAPAPRDAFAERFRAAADEFSLLPPEVEAAAHLIAAAELDLLVYPDLGMDPFTYFLAFWRLAPIQCVCAGHPSTTGVDSIDWFLSDARAEPLAAEQHYSERLLRAKDFFLPIYDRPAPQGGTGAATPQEGRRVYVCGQTIMKLHPDFDAMLEDILRTDRQGEILLYADRHELTNRIVAERLAARLGTAMDRVRIIGRQTYGEYLQTVGRASVILDTPHFSGGNTTLEALSLHVPIVTLPGEFLRGRFAGARLEGFGLRDCIATDARDYAAKAVAIAGSAALRKRIVECLAGRADEEISPFRPVAGFAAALDRLLADDS